MKKVTKFVIIFIIVSISNFEVHASQNSADQGSIYTPPIEEQKIDQDLKLNPLPDPYQNNKGNYGTNNGIHGNNNLANDENYQRELNKILDGLQEDLNKPTLDNKLQPISVKPNSFNNSSASDNTISNKDKKILFRGFLIILFVAIIFLLVKKYSPIIIEILKVRDITKSKITKSEALTLLKEKKDLLDLGVISSEEYEKAKNTLSQYLMK